MGIMKRHQEPKFISDWREWLNAGPPKCCHTCDNYDQSGSCIKYGSIPPQDFAQSIDACADWALEIPF